MKKINYFLLISSFLILYLSNSNCQSNYLIKGGVGLPELAGVSLGIQEQNFQFTVGAGMIPIPEDFLHSLYGDLFLHFLGESDYTNTKPWFARLGLKSFQETTPRWIDRYSYLDVRFGRSMSFSERLSLELDLGAAFILSYKREEIIPTTYGFTIEFPFIPAFGTRLTYRFTN